MQSHAVRRALRAGQKVDLRHGRDGRERFAAEAEGADAGKVLFFADLARCVAQEGRVGVVRGHAAAVVGDRNEPGTGALDFNADPPGTGVDRVFNQLLDHRRRAFDDFACRDAVAELFGHHFNLAHR